ncbi:General substrate transporter [Rhizoctonia solani]|uniref:General substrate transporter n=1 Tax=Rhizoctonia solani TaxID=456999 RepID=A0A8H7M437_9AGAM|nr:General substrate transporter [Rhizoctonia solani]
MALSPKVYTWLCGCFAALGSILFGYDLGIIASVLPSETFLDVVGHPSDNEIGLITSLFLLGAFFGSAPSGVIADSIGRRKAIVVGCIIFIIGGCLQTAAVNLGMMMAGRFLAGWGVGQLAHLAPLFQSEIAHSSIRGRLTTLQQFFLGIGAFIASFIGYGCYNRLQGTQAQWRLPLGLQLFPAVPLALLIHAFPESPRWLAMKGRHDDALKTLARLHANGNTSDIFVQTELADIEASIEKEREESRNAWSLLFFEPSNRRRLLLGVILQFSVQMTGVSAIQYYAPAIFEEVGFDAGQTLLFQSINSIIALFGEAACVLLVDRLGRRWPLIIANAFSSSTFVIGTAIIAGNKSAHYAFVVMTWLFNFAFSSAIGPISWAYPVEIFGSATRARGTAITSMAAWIANFMIAQVTPHAFSNIGWKYYLVFAICGYTNALTFWALFPKPRVGNSKKWTTFSSILAGSFRLPIHPSFGDSTGKRNAGWTAVLCTRIVNTHCTQRSSKSKSVRAPKSHGGSRPGSHIAQTDDSDDYVDYATCVHDILNSYDWEPETGANVNNNHRSPRNTQISLAEIIQIKPGRKKKANTIYTTVPEGDFEMVPRPGKVLVLDEENDEWENISMGVLRDESNVAQLGFPPLSYAAALSRR